jgi:protein-disulfide isomerase
MASETNQRSNASIWLALAAGLAVGFAVGREMGPRGGAAAEPTAAARPAAAAPSGPSYKSESQFPAAWLKAADLTAVKGVSFTGLSDTQKATALQALNERKCNCGCGMESIAICAKKDPLCPKSPGLVKNVVDQVKQGKTLADVLTYLDAASPPGAAAAPQAAPPPPGPKKVAIPAHAPRKGPKAPKVTIVEFSDFQCPFCGRAEASIKEVTDKYPRDVAVVYVNQPLSFHNNAMGAAQAFLAADRQGKAWEMHGKMFAHQTALGREDLDKYAQEIGLNMARFKKDFDDPKIQALIKSDQTLANSVGADGTPTFFINGRQIVGAESFATFKAIIDDEIKKADELLKKGTRPDQLYGKLSDQNVAAAPAAPAPAPAAAAEAAPPPDEKVDVAAGDAPSKGPKNAPVTIIEFSDFQCPYCSRVVPVLKEIHDAYGDKVRVAFKHLPLDMHPFAQTAAEAAMAANEQGKFWEMHDKLFANQQQLDRLSLDKYAADVGLNVPRFKAALDSGKYRERVKQDAAEAAKLGISGTPTLFVNGHKLVGAQPFPMFKTAIDKELAAKGK